MWMGVAALFLQASPAPCAAAPRPSGPPALIVQAVDSGWLPLPGMEVRIESRDGKRVKRVGQTDTNGYVEFWLPGDTEYGVEIGSPGIKIKRLKSVRLGTPSETFPTAYIQFQLEGSGPFVQVE